MNQFVLTDEKQVPTEKIIYSHIGKSKTIWKLLFDHIHSNYPDLTEEWRYYKDGKSWLMKVVKKKKTIFWLSINEDGFVITFYFTDKAEDLIFKSLISDELKAQFRNGKRYNKIRGLTVKMDSKQNFEYAKELMAMKFSLK